MSTRKSQQFFFNLEKQRGAQDTTKTLTVDDKETRSDTYFRMYKGKWEQKLLQKLKVFSVMSISKTL